MTKNELIEILQNSISGNPEVLVLVPDIFNGVFNSVECCVKGVYDSGMIAIQPLDDIEGE